ncbi:MAG TPA: S1C family serine protease [Candidatus Limnocylindrales bacterium]|nr:S1C family serine protease [Candidatus Limnocylindrales bacterium]
MAVLDEVAGALANVAEKVGPSVVRIGGGWRGGSGVVIGDGAVLTNAHNVRGEEVTVVFADGRRTVGSVSGIDVDGDLAVVSVDTGSTAVVDWAGAQATIGTPIFAVAHNGDGARVTFGFVSSVARAFRGPRGRRISGSVEHTAPLAPGSSGSPLVDGEGRLLGLNTNRLGGGFYLALPADEALRGRVAALQRGESAERPRLGIGIAPSWVALRMRRAVGLPDREGVLVREVEPGSPAARAGINEGDLLVEAGGRPITEPDDVYDALGSVSAGSTLELRLVRGAEELTVQASFAETSESEPAAGGESGGPVH